MKLTLSGPAESSGNALAKALAKQTIVATTRASAERDVTIHDAASGATQTAQLDGARGSDGSYAVTFDRLGVEIEVAAEAGDVGEALTKLEGRRVDAADEAGVAAGPRHLVLFGDETAPAGRRDGLP